MKKIAVLFLLVGIVYGCTKNEVNLKESDLMGKWKLIEVLADPGDGSGTFRQVNSNKIIEFHSDGTLTSNGSICNMSTEADSPSSATYSLSDSTINSPECENTAMRLKFERSGSTLIISYPCIEPCRAKFIKAEK